MDISPALKEAMELHQKGETDSAIQSYQKLVDEKSKDKRVYVNLAALLRQSDEPTRAAKIINLGLKNVDNNSPMLLNTLGNCLRDLKRYSEAINMYRRALKYSPGYFDAQISIVGTLYNAGYHELSDRCLYSLFLFYGADKKPILNQLITREIEKSCLENRNINPNLEKVLFHVDSLSTVEEPRLPIHWFLLAHLCCDANKIEDAIKYFQKACDATKSVIQISPEGATQENAKKLHTLQSWNFSCSLLRQGEMALGWHLYDYGLNTPAEGAQRWQRALFKPFSFSKVPLWKGQDLQNKSILLLGEQGIGDTMAFITLTNEIIKQAKTTSFIVPDRLAKIYTRTLQNAIIYSDKDFKKNPESPDQFDYQAPLGSIIKHIYKDLKTHKDNKFSIKADRNVSNSLRVKYQNHLKNAPIIGISWQGGGRKDRINDKSINLNELLKALSEYQLLLVSLQYGDDAKIVSSAAKKHNLSFIDDPDIQATTDMDNWINQVDACDGVISIANTTIHGAGGLGKPTLCLLGSKSDWRWLKDRQETKSYWYPSVDIAWQDSDNHSWDNALSQIPSWLKTNGFLK